MSLNACYTVTLISTPHNSTTAQLAGGEVYLGVVPVQGRALEDYSPHIGHKELLRLILLHIAELQVREHLWRRREGGREGGREEGMEEEGKE